MKKLSVIILIFSLFALQFVSCTPKSKSGNKVMDMTEEEIVKGSTYSKSSSSMKTINNKTTINVKHFSGIEKILNFSPRKNAIEINISSTVSAGDLRIVLCDDTSIIYEFEAGKENQTFRLNQSSAKYYLKVVGDDTRYTLVVDYQAIKTDLPSFEATIL